MKNEIDWMRDMDCLQAFAEKYEALFDNFIEEYQIDLELARADKLNEIERDELE